MLTLVLALQIALQFTTLAAGSQSGIEQPRTVTIRTAAQYQALWKEHDPAAPAPSVDFTKEAVVGVFLGSRMTAGFEVTITAIKQENGKAVVEYVERVPRPSGMVAQVITAPYHLVRVSRDIGTVDFKKAR